MKSLLSLLASVILLMVCISPSSALENADLQTVFSPELADKCKTLLPGEQLTVIAYLIHQPDIRSIDLQLTQMRATRQQRHQVVVDELRYAAEHSQSELRAHITELAQKGDISGYTPYWIVNAIVFSGNQSAIETIAEHSSIEWMDVSFQTRLIEPIDYRRTRSMPLDENHGVPTGIRAIGARRVWYELGFTGAGRIVGNIDTGVDGSHPALAARWRGTNAPADECWLDVVRNSQFPEDDSPSGGHGTHVMGTICGNSTTTNDSIGVAPEASWIACNAIDQGSSNAFDNDILAAFQWMTDPDSNSGTINDVPDVVQNSWGVDGRFPGYSDCYQIWNEAIVNCEAAGVVVTFSAGNEGPSTRTLRSPATVALDSVTVFTIGAVDANADTIPPYDIASFSSRGPTDCPPFVAIKPEVCAPGVMVYSSIPDGNYTRFSGTSMAGPHVAGVVALMREANPNAEVREIKSVLMRTALDYGAEGEDNAYGFGFVDAFEAVLEISANRGIVMGIVTDAVSSDPIEHAVVNAGGRIRQTDSNGAYTLSLPGDSVWTLIFSAYGYENDTVAIELDIADTVTVNIAMTPVPQGEIRGTVLCGADVPVIGAEIQFVGTSLPHEITDSNGEFFARVPGDSLYLIEAAFDGVSTQASAFVAVGGSVEQNLYLESPLSLPQGPDVYGYRAYDNLDFDIPPTYDWYEIAPSRGGPGTLMTIQDRDSSVFLDLPFQFRYYGRSYDSITVNENGWIAAGMSHDHSFFNFQIPSASGPPAMMALYWDNLEWHQDQSELCVFYDSLNCRYIIEYLDVRFASASDLGMTCQLHIYDPRAFPTPTGDSEILMLYERMDIPNSATVGIESHTELIGVQCNFNGTMSSNTWSIRPGTALLFTTRTAGWSKAILNGQITAHPQPESWNQVFVRVGCEYVRLIDDGSFWSDEILVGNHDVELLMPGYEYAETNLRFSVDSTTNWGAEVWRLDPPRDLEGEINGESLTLTWREPFSVAEGLDEFVEYRVFRNGAQIAVTQEESLQEQISGTESRDYYVIASYDGGVSDSSNHFLYNPVGVTDPHSNLPTEFAVSSPYPNPFNPTTSLEIALPTNAWLKVSAYDVLGRHVATLHDSPATAGYHSLKWNAASLCSGLYFIQIETIVGKRMVKAVLLK